MPSKQVVKREQRERESHFLQVDRADRQASQLMLQCVEDIYTSQVLYIYLYTV